MKLSVRISAVVMLSGIVLCSCVGNRNQGASSESLAQVGEGVENAQLIVLTDAVSSDTVYMGRMGSGEIVTKPLRIKNGSSEPVVIIDIDKTCGCVDFTYRRQPLKPGEEAVMELEFDSRGITGWVYKTAIVKTSSPAGEHLIVVTADVR